MAWSIGAGLSAGKIVLFPSTGITFIALIAFSIGSNSIFTYL